MATGSCPKETEEHKELVRHMRTRGIPHFHVPNENSKRSHRFVNASLGVSSGVPDLFCIVTDVRGKKHLVAIEMKRVKKSLSKVSPAQRKWLELLQQAGIVAVVAYGAEEGKRVIEKIMRG